MLLKFLVMIPVLKISHIIMYYVLPRKMALSLMDAYIKHNLAGAGDPQEMLETIGGNTMLKHILEHAWVEFTSGGIIFVGDDIPDIPLLKLSPDLKTSDCNLTDLIRKNRPLVLNFGSCT